MQVSATATVLEKWMSEVDKWKEKVENLCNNNKWLYFFRVPKLMVLHEALTTENPSVHTIIQEIGFLFKRNAHASESFKSAVKVSKYSFLQSPKYTLCQFHFLSRLL